MPLQQADRHGSLVHVRDSRGKWQTASENLARYDSMLTQIADPTLAPEVLILRAAFVLGVFTIAFSLMNFPQHGRHKSARILRCYFTTVVI